MNETSFENRLRTAVEHATPDVLDNILSQCASPEQDKIVPIASRRAPAGAKRRVRSLVAAAAALALMVGLFGFGQYNRAYAADSLVSINADTDISLEINVKGDVISAKVNDTDGEALLQELDLEGMDAEAAVKAIAEALVETGLVTGDDNSLIISVTNDDMEKARELETRLIEAIKTALEESDISAAIIGLLPEEGGEAGTDAKSVLIDKALESLEGYTGEELGSLTVNELNLLIEDRSIKLDGAITVGSPSDGSVVGAETAGVTATAHAGMTETGGFNAGVELDCKYGKLVYDVGFEDGSLSFTYNIDAVTGLILSWAAKSTDGSGAEAGSEKSDISLDQARDIAFDHAGLSLDDVNHIAIDVSESTGSLTYDVQFSAGGMEYEYDVDAATGAIIKYAAALLEGVISSARDSGGSAAPEQPAEVSTVPADFSDMTPEDVRDLVGSIFDFIEKVG